MIFIDFEIIVEVTANFLGRFKFSDDFNILVKGGFENSTVETVAADLPVKRWWGGFAFHWFPVENLRVHAVASYDHLFSYLSLTAGILYNISIF